MIYAVVEVHALVQGVVMAVATVIVLGGKTIEDASEHNENLLPGMRQQGLISHLFKHFAEALW